MINRHLRTHLRQDIKLQEVNGNGTVPGVKMSDDFILNEIKPEL